MMLRGILTIFLVITGLYLAFTNLPSLGWFNWGNEEGRALATDKIKNIEIETSSVHTVVIPEDRNDVETEYEGKGKVTAQLNGDTLEIHAKGPKLQFFNMNNDKEKLKIYVPENYHQNMQISVGSGFLSFGEGSRKSAMKLEELRLKAGSGRIEIGPLEAGSVDYDLSSGEIVSDSLTTKNGVFKVSSGRLKLDQYSGPAEANVSSGELHIKMEKLAGPMEIDVSSGHAELDLPDDADFALNGKISSGNISNSFPLSGESSSSNKIKGHHGSGKHTINLNVSSGNISLH